MASYIPVNANAGHARPGCMQELSLYCGRSSAPQVGCGGDCLAAAHQFVKGEASSWRVTSFSLHISRALGPCIVSPKHRRVLSSVASLPLHPVMQVRKVEMVRDVNDYPTYVKPVDELKIVGPK